MKLTWCHNRLAIASSCNGDEPILRNSAEVAEVLNAAGVTHLIVLRQDPGFMGGVVTVEVLHGITALWNPIDDDGWPKPALWFARSIDFALHALANPHHKVAVCCYHGNNRAPSTALAILMAQGLRSEDALELILNERPTAEILYSEDAKKAVKELRYC